MAVGIWDSLDSMKAFFSSVFWISVALSLAFWGLYVVDTTSYAKMGNVHELTAASVVIERSRDEVFERVSKIKITRPSDDEQASDVAEPEAAPEARPSFDGQSMFELPGFQGLGRSSVLLVEHRLPDFLMYQERHQKVIFIHGMGFEEIRPGVTELSWQIQSPNTQWWFHGFILHPAAYFWDGQVSKVLKTIKKKLEQD